MIRYQRRKYKLVNTDNGNSIILNGQGTNYEPKNWDNSERELKRSTKNYSITTILSKELEFIGSGANFLIQAYNTKGIEANVKMFEYRYDTPNSEPYIYSVGDFDFSDYSRENNIVKVPFNSGGLNSLIKSKRSDKFELERTESIDGNDIGELVKDEFAVVNRPIFLDSLMITDPVQNNSNEFRMKFNAGWRMGFAPVPVEVDYESDDSVLTVVNDQFKVMGFTNVIGNIAQDNPFDGIRSHMFYYNSDVDKVLSIKINLTIKVDLTRTEDTEYKHLSIRLANLAGDDDPTLNFPLIPYSDVTTGDKFPEFSYFKTIQNLNDIFSSDPKTYSIEYEDDVFVSKGNSLALYLFGGGDFEEFAGNAYFNLNTSDIDCTISIQENSQRSDINRRSNSITNNNIGERLMAIINNDKDTYKSDFFKSGDFKLSSITTGKLIRGFKDSTITISLKQFLDNAMALFNMGYNIEIIDGVETLVHEPLKHFFRSETKIIIKEQVNKVKRSVAKEFIYSSVSSGYKKPSGDNLYEEVNGLTEVNTTNTYTTPITRIEKEYNIESPFRADSEGKELTLRQSIQVNPTGDYRTDKTLFNLDLKNVGTNVYEEKIWSDYYEELPKSGQTSDTQVFSPETLTGLAFTPFRNLERHAWFLNSAFTKFSEKYIRYSSTRSNSDFITKKSGEIERAENGNYQINTLENAIFVSEWIEFEYPVDSELLEQVNGFTTVNGRKTPNIYFKVEFINEFNQKEYGYLFNFKPQKEGKWKLLKAL